ncbi:hypothetical protein EV14_0722 [Prochlorococcus sp. MIT 0703]|nr:hypothetical protein EV14_0722 [Prochlorococcus sp. MIT 0703]
MPDTPLPLCSYSPAKAWNGLPQPDQQLQLFWPSTTLPAFEVDQKGCLWIKTLRQTSTH